MICAGRTLTNDNRAQKGRKVSCFFTGRGHGTAHSAGEDHTPVVGGKKPLLSYGGLNRRARKALYVIEQRVIKTRRNDLPVMLKVDVPLLDKGFVRELNEGALRHGGDIQRNRDENLRKNRPSRKGNKPSKLQI